MAEQRLHTITVQIMGLVAASVVLATVAIFVVTFGGPPPLSRPIPISVVAKAVTSGSADLPDNATIDTVAVPPDHVAGMHRDDAAAKALATLTGLPAIVFTTRPVAGSALGAPGGEESEFRGGVTAAILQGTRWRVLTIPPDPMFSAWHLATLGAMLGTLLMLMALAWPIARRITDPLARLASTADAMRALPSDPPVSVEGPPEVRRVAEALARMRDRLNSSVSARTDMLIGIAHDMGTPLTRLAFHTELLPENTRNAAIEEVVTMRTMIGSVLDFARETAPERSPVDIAALLRQLAEASIASGQQVTVDAPAQAIVFGDTAALRRLFGNLVENALRYAGDCEIEVISDGHMFTIDVRDTGPGLPGDIEMLFEPFVRGEKSRSRETGGMGLGLALARRITDAHRGSIIAANRPTAGAVFTVRLPAA